jgi:hypothetical protein
VIPHRLHGLLTAQLRGDAADPRRAERTPVLRPLPAAADQGNG